MVIGLTRVVVRALVLAGLGVLGCADEHGASSREYAELRGALEGEEVLLGTRVELDEVIEDGCALQKSLNLCDMVRGSPNAGFYRVESLTAVKEKIPGQGDESAWFTYVEVTLLDSWQTGEAGPTAVTARVPGDRSGIVSLRVGEELGIVFLAPTEENLGFHRMSSKNLFKPKADGGYSNGAVLTRARLGAVELGESVRKALAESTRTRYHTCS